MSVIFLTLWWIVVKDHKVGDQVEAMIPTDYSWRRRETEHFLSSYFEDPCL